MNKGKREKRKGKQSSSKNKVSLFFNKLEIMPEITLSFFNQRNKPYSNSEQDVYTSLADDA